MKLITLLLASTILTTPAFAASSFLIDAAGPGDEGFIGGQTVDRGNIQITGTDRPQIYRTERWGLEGYKLDIKDGTYDITLYFAETYKGIKKPGQRVFSVTAEGKPFGDPIDVFKEVGANKALTRTQRIEVTGGLDLQFVGKAPMISAIEVSLPGVFYTDVTTPPLDDDDPPPPPQDDDPPIPSSGCGNDIPAAAKALGMKLAFCEDFSDPSRINLDGRLNSGQTFTQVTQGNIFNAQPLPKSAISFSNGTMTVKPTHNQYQVDFISSYKGNGFILKAPFYAEIRWKHDNCKQGSKPGFPAFWTMDSDHLYGTTNGGYLEPDFYEYIGGSDIRALHNWLAPGKRTSGQKSLGGFNTEEYFTAGALATNSYYSWFRNGKQVHSVSPSWIGMFSTFNGPLMVGSGPGCNYTVDYVKAYMK